MVVLFQDTEFTESATAFWSTGGLVGGHDAIHQRLVQKRRFYLLHHFLNMGWTMISTRMKTQHASASLVLAVLVGYSVLVSSVPHSCSFKTCHHSFDWVNNTASVAASGTFDYNCPIADFRENKHYKSLKDYQIAYIGDSLDLQGCAYIRDYNTTNSESWTWNNSATHIHCYHDAHIEVNMLRVSGIVFSNHNSTTNPSFKAIRNWLPSLTPDVVVLSSYVWDLKAVHGQYCGEGGATENPCLCHYKDFEKPECAKVANGQVFNRMQIPWCGPAFLSLWRSTFLELVALVQSILPRAKIFVRNQPFASALFTGNPQCLASMNALALEISNTLLPAEESAGSCRFLDMNALMAPVTGSQLGHNPNSRAANDGLHYWDARHMWTEYLLNTIIDNVALENGTARAV